MSEQFALVREKSGRFEYEGPVSLVMRFDGSKLYVAGKDKDKVDYWKDFFSSDEKKKELRSEKRNFFGFFGSGSLAVEVLSGDEGQQAYMDAMMDLQGSPSFVERIM